MSRGDAPGRGRVPYLAREGMPTLRVHSAIMQNPTAYSPSQLQARDSIAWPAAVPLALLLSLCACAAPAAETEIEATPFVAPEPETPLTIGFFLTELDASLRAWSTYQLTANTAREMRMLRSLERDLGLRTQRRFKDIVAELESGPPTNRAVAAFGLGFSGNPAALSPLLNALSDRDALVVNNALLGLGRLSMPETPLAIPASLLRSHPDAWTRNNAAFAIQGVIAAGGESAEAIEACRAALIDAEPGVRAQAASVLGIVVDTASFEGLADLVHDSVPLASAAGTAALGHIGAAVPALKGRTARRFVQALTHLEGPRRTRVLIELTLLNGINLGEDASDWSEWANRLP